MTRGQGFNSGIFWAVFLALLAFGGVVLAVQSYREHRAEQTVNAALQGLADQSQQMSRQAQDSSRQRRIARARKDAEHQRLARCDRDARVLDVSQQCLGGTVIHRDGHRYTQILGRDQAPIKCSGRYASQRLRVVPGCTR